MNTKKQTKPKESSFVRTESWGTFTLGDPVKVVSGFLKGKQTSHWEFRSHVSNPDTGSEWIEIFGGYRGVPDSLRAVKAEDIELIKVKQKRKSK